MEDLRLILFGTGLYYNNRKNSDCIKKNNIIAFLDSDPLKQNSKMDGYPVVAPINVGQFEFDYVVIMSKYQKEMKNQLLDYDISEKQIIDFSQLERITYSKNIVIFGTGLYYHNRKDNACLKKYNTIAFLDNDVQKQGTILDGIPILEPREIIKLKYDYIVIMSIYYDQMFGQLVSLGVDKNKIGSFRQIIELEESHNYFAGTIPEEILVEEEKWNPLVSVIVPNYNHELYLEKRLESIYNQTYNNFEVILLDDSSTDRSREILKKYAQKYSQNTRCVFNEVNVGKVFWQWNKGIKLANGELIWIAESDDYCDDNFLEVLVNEFRRQSVMLAFAQSIFIQEDKPIWTMNEYLYDISAFNWRENFVATADYAVKNAFSLKNIIPNASSAVFRNIGEISENVLRLWEELNLCGDWIFYLNIIKGGCISYSTETTNYYRIHKSSTSKQIQKNFSYYTEHMVVSKYVRQNYRVEDVIFKRELQILKKHYINNTGEKNAEIIEKYYKVDEILNSNINRSPNILMCCFTLELGGGETYPLYLANELKSQEMAVTVLDFNMGKYDEAIRKLLNPNVPLVRIKNLNKLASIIKCYGGEIIHSHHASVDSTISECLLYNKDLDCKQIITLHGMYESITEASAKRSINFVKQTCQKYIYIADKNLIPFKVNGVFENNMEKFIKLPNGLPITKIRPIERKNLGIDRDDFVLCLVSRALPEKGWAEAIEALHLAQEQTNRKLHLLLLGSGEMYDRLKGLNDPAVHLMGRVKNTRDYFAMSDVGFLPTRFMGESYPLVIIDSLLCGKPVLATDIAEIKNQITDEEGNLAGELFSFDGNLNIQEIAQKIVKLADDNTYYRILESRTSSVAQKFDIKKITRKYCQIYEDIYWRSKKNNFSTPKVSVIMPVYNGEAYISMAIESILNQTYPNFELILVDDCGNDASIDIAMSYADKDSRIRIIHNKENKGIAYSRNVGLAQCRGDYIAIMDDDDYSFPYRFEKQIEYLESHPDVGVLGGSAQWIDEAGNVIKETIPVLTDPAYIKAMYLFFNIFNNSEVMFRKSLIIEYHIQYEDGLLGMEDFKFWIRCSKVTNFANLDLLLLQHRMTGTNETFRVLNAQKNDREEIFGKLHQFSLEESGFKLEDREFKILNSVLDENGLMTPENSIALIEFYQVLKKLVVQAKEMDLDFRMAMEDWFRNLMLDKMRQMKLEDFWR